MCGGWCSADGAAARRCAPGPSLRRHAVGDGRGRRQPQRLVGGHPPEQAYGRGDDRRQPGDRHTSGAYGAESRPAAARPVPPRKAASSRHSSTYCSGASRSMKASSSAGSQSVPGGTEGSVKSPSVRGPMAMSGGWPKSSACARCLPSPAGGCHCSWPKTCRLSYVGGAPSSRYMRCLATGPLPRPDGRVAPRARVLPRSRSPAPPQLENRFPRLLTHAWSNASAPVGVCGIGVNEVHCRQPPTRSTVETPGARPAASKLPAEGFPSADVVLDVGRDSATSTFGSPIRTAHLRGLRPGSRLHHAFALPLTTAVTHVATSSCADAWADPEGPGRELLRTLLRPVCQTRWAREQFSGRPAPGAAPSPLRS